MNPDPPKTMMVPLKDLSFRSSYRKIGWELDGAEAFDRVFAGLQSGIEDS
jgi:hypothetical protein